MSFKIVSGSPPYENYFTGEVEQMPLKCGRIRVGVTGSIAVRSVLLENPGGWVTVHIEINGSASLLCLGGGWKDIRRSGNDEVILGRFSPPPFQLQVVADRPVAPRFFYGIAKALQVFEWRGGEDLPGGAIHLGAGFYVVPQGGKLTEETMARRCLLGNPPVDLADSFSDVGGQIFTPK
ncbi:hypothetical protein C4577_01095 [Candidatus Parcubacteria bacterium]|nr:MAG: hypothetical protein C4577_01095 [Candidatus Parcubacteria bacterium]